jgi:NDP-sugar pyrophosphorylase family protein
MLPIAILAGGLATRLGPITRDVPKSLININGIPFINWQLNLLKDSGYENFVLCLSHQSELVIEHVGDGSKFGVNIEYSLDGSKQLGTGGAVRKALPLLGDKFAVIYGDSYLPINFNEVESAFLNSRALGLMTVFRNLGQFDTSNVEFLGNKVIEYKKGGKETRMKFIDYGITYFKSEAFKAKHIGDAFDLASLLSDLSSTQKLDGFEVFNRFYEIGSNLGIQEFSTYMKGLKNEF